MAYKCSFLDNEVYTAGDVCDIFARVTWGGVLFTDTGDVFSDLNASAGSLSTDGVTRDPDSCRVVFNDGVYKISKGACIMNDGTAITFDSNGQVIDVPEGQYSYVYLKRNTVENSIDIVVSEYSGDEDFVPLAEIDESGVIHDRRTYAKAKVDIGEAEALRNFTVYFTECRATKSETVTVDFGDEMFNYIIMWDGERVSSTGSRQARVANERNLKELINGEEILLSIGALQGDHKEYMRLKKAGSKLHIYLTNPLPYADYTLNLGVI